MNAPTSSMAPDLSAIAAVRNAAETYAALRAAEPVGPPFERQDLDGHGATYSHRRAGLDVIESVYPYGRNAELWLHVSFSRRSRVPDWDDIKLVRAYFIGLERECYQVLPSADRWVTHHPYTLHLWCNLSVPGGAVLPDFRIAGTI